MFHLYAHDVRRAGTVLLSVLEWAGNSGVMRIRSAVASGRKTGRAKRDNAPGSFIRPAP